MSYGIIYSITNTLNGKIYVGQTTQSLEKRWKQHVADTKRSSYPLQNAIKSYGEQNFETQILKECQTEEELNEQELFFAINLDSFSPKGYNLRAGTGRGSVSEEVRRNHSIKMTGENNPNFGRTGDKHPLFGKKGKDNPNYGRKHSPETRAKNSAANIGDKNPNFGKPRSEETKNKIGASHAKTYYFINPDGQNITITNLSKLCREENLSSSHMCQVSAGKRQHHKGWKRDNEKYLSKNYELIPPKYYTKTYYFISPTGEQIVITNLNKFCKDHPDNLNQGRMWAVANEKQKQHKGWSKDYEAYILSQSNLQ